jgi:phosphomannomutase
MAIEYYISHDPRKMQHFQRKLTSLLTHPNTLQAIENRNPSREAETKKGASTGTYTKNLKHEMNKFNSESGMLVKSMLEGSEIKAINSNRLINQNISNQEEALRIRLESRSKSKSFKSSIR